MTAPTVVNVTRHRARIPSSSSSSSSSASHGQHPPGPSQDDRTTLTHEALKTSLEQAKLERRRYEHAMLRDALRRGTPYSYLPGLLARSGAEGAQQRPDRHAPEAVITSPHTVSPVRWTSGVVRPQTGAIYMTHFVASPVGGGIVPAGRRLNLDDSFLRRAYKRRRSWGAGRGKHRRGQSSGEISFHHWVPGSNGEERRV
ncbi:hypothetical protein HFD88_009171 [Aspergillus terreus]|nr:hypothetical protein HFD88_009171 [Aspergillus terreus]